MTEAWPSVHPERGMLNDLALLALILPGIFLAEFAAWTGKATPLERLLILSIDLFAVALTVLLTLFLNR